MKSCLLCPKGTKCQGYTIHQVLLKLDMALAQRKTGDADTIAGNLQREDMVVLAKMGEAARQTCWTKAVVLVVARRFAELGSLQLPPPRLKQAIESVIVRMDMLCNRLPKGISVKIDDLSMDIYNESLGILAAQGDQAFLPANVLSQALGAQIRAKSLG